MGTDIDYFLANFLRINIYLTQKLKEDTIWNIVVNDAGAEYDPLTLLRTRTMYGRPDWKAIFGRLRNSIELGQYLPGSTSQLKTRVGVYFCGVRSYFIRMQRSTNRCCSLPFSPRLFKSNPCLPQARLFSSLSPRFVPFSALFNEQLLMVAL